MSPEYQRGMGGSQRGAIVAARTWPSTRRKNRASSTAMTTAYARALGRCSISGGLTRCRSRRPTLQTRRDAIRGQPGIASDVVEAARRVVRVAHEVEVRLVRARDAVGAERKSLRVDPNQAA